MLLKYVFVFANYVHVYLRVKVAHSRVKRPCLAQFRFELLVGSVTEDK